MVALTANPTKWPIWRSSDNLGTVRDLAVYDGTDTTVVNHKVYDAFGNITDEQHYDSSGTPIDELDPDAVDTIFAFTGQEFDDETGLYYYNERYYDSATGRFLSPDPIQDDYNNPYRYVGNDPLNNVDPSGLEEISANALKDGRVLYLRYNADDLRKLGFTEANGERNGVRNRFLDLKGQLCYAVGREKRCQEPFS